MKIHSDPNYSLFYGEDWCWTEPLGTVSFDETVKHDPKSISKSVTSLLVGIAVDRGWISDINRQKVRPSAKIYQGQKSANTRARDGIIQFQEWTSSPPRNVIAFAQRDHRAPTGGPSP